MTERENFISRNASLSLDELADIYIHKADYAPNYIVLVEEELQKRGCILSELTPDNIHQILMSKKTDADLIEIYTNADYYTQKELEAVLVEIKKRNLPMDIISAEKSDNHISFISGEQGSSITIGYILSICLGGIIGLIIGCQYAFATRTNKDGEKFPRYNKSTRTHGERMLIISGILMIVRILALITR